MWRPCRSPLALSSGRERASKLTRALGDYLTTSLERPFEIYVADDYRAIEDDLSSGNAHFAWAPPNICRRAQERGAQIMLRLVRYGCSRYRSALVRRRGESLDLGDISQLKVAWVSAASTGGYLLAKDWLEAQDVRVYDAWSTTFCGSYAAALDGEADLTAVYASGVDSGSHYSALDDLHPEDRARLEIFAFTEETLNDGLLASATVEEELVDACARSLERADKALLKQVFDATDLERAHE